MLKLLFGNRIPLKSLAMVCRSLSTLLQSGVAIQKAFDVASGKTGNPRLRESMQTIATSVRSGHDVSSALKAQSDYFPELMIDMVEIAEQSGALPEVLTGLADHYDNTLRLRKDFIGAIAWPVFQFVAAVFVIAILILVLGMIATSQGGEPIDFIGFGLTGPTGAVIWLTTVFGTIFGLFVAYQVTARSMGGKKFLDPLLMKIPVVGYCMQSFAIARFSWAFYLTQQTGMPIRNSMEASLKATTNGAYLAASPMMCQLLSEGEDLSTTLATSRLFPDDFLQMVSVAENSGTVPEMLHRLSPQFDDQARRSLKMLTAALAWSVWAAVAMFIVYFIFRFIFWYTGMIQDALKQTSI